jgi:pantoate--beta-alanine ligase
MGGSTLMTTKVFNTISEFKNWRQQVSGSVGLVTTMGALHEGHFSLMERARELADNLVVYIFVNPLQFGPNEDFATYPRTLEKDLENCSKMGAQAVFCPSAEEIYPDGKDFCTKVVPPPELADVLEGAFRPGFFVGVTTVLAKFFSIIDPDITVFGEKDYQQLLIVKRLVKDLNMRVTVYGAPTNRAQEGLALSSRNAYLSADQRDAAPKIYQILGATAAKIKANPKAVKEAIEAGKKQFADTGVINLQYLEARDAETFAPVDHFDRKIVLLTAAKIGNVRLIDNVVIQ